MNSNNSYLLFLSSWSKPTKIMNNLVNNYNPYKTEMNNYKNNMMS